MTRRKKRVLDSTYAINRVQDFLEGQRLPESGLEERFNTALGLVWLLAKQIPQLIRKATNSITATFWNVYDAFQEHIGYEEIQPELLLIFAAVIVAVIVAMGACALSQ